jgi:UDP:flavonoid glycosyltransferase YjiC (YdhE family)
VSRPQRFLIVSWDGGGNTPPAYNLGTRLQRRGHHVRMLGWESMAERAAAASIEFSVYPSVPPWPPELSYDDGWDRIQEPLHGTATRDDIIAEVRAFAPDVLVLDCMMRAGFTAARELGLPTAVLNHVLYSAFAAEWGDMVMGITVSDVYAAMDRVLVVIPPGFDAPVPIPANTAYVGPITHPEAGHRVDGLSRADQRMLTGPGNPWVLLSLSSTLQGQMAALPAMLAAMESVSARVLLTLGGVIPVNAVVTPHNVVVREFVPHDIVLPHMSAVVCHGGLSTITTTLAAGVPLVCIPQGRDQHMNAARVEACGAGRMVAPDAAPADLAAAIVAVLDDNQARAVARGFAATIESLGSGAQATLDVERLAQLPVHGGQ